MNRLLGVRIRGGSISTTIGEDDLSKCVPAKRTRLSLGDSSALLDTVRSPAQQPVRVTRKNLSGSDQTAKQKEAELHELGAPAIFKQKS